MRSFDRFIRLLKQGFIFVFDQNTLSVRRRSLGFYLAFCWENRYNVKDTIRVCTQLEAPESGQGLFKRVAASCASPDIHGEGVYLLKALSIHSILYQWPPHRIILAAPAIASLSSRAFKAKGVLCDKGVR